MLLFALLYRGALAPFIEVYLPLELLLVGLALAAIRSMREVRKQLSAQRRMALGVDSWAARSVPSAPAAYVTWCADRGIEPYPHGRPQHAPAAAERLAAAPDPA